MKKAVRSISAALLAAMALSGCSGGQSGENNSRAEEQTSVSVSAGTENTASAETAEPLEKYMITCAEIAYKALNGDVKELPRTMEVTDEVMLTDVMGYDISLFEDYSVNMQLVSADLFELTVIKASEENSEAVMAMLDERLRYIKEQAAFYPAQVATAEAALNGHTGDHYYLICSDKSKELEKLVISAIVRN